MFSKADNVRAFLFAFLEVEVFPQKGSTLIGNNLLQWEQILFSMTPIIWEVTMTMTVA